jgi:serine-type D-Ala-D-Ala carboxypeptidase (penicillin-binding protein 5/6)
LPHAARAAWLFFFFGYSMKRLFAFLLAPLVALALAGAASAQALPAPEVASKSYILVDMTSNQVLAERDADAASDPASLTKLMTAYLAFNAVKEKRLALDQKVTVSRRAWEERKGGGSLMFIDTTMTPTVDELLHGVIIQSGNDASVAIAEAVGGTLDQFVAMMNRQAQAWGLKNTSFKNVTGLTEPGHRSTARDVAAMAAHIIREHPEFYAYYSIKDYKYNNIAQPNRNLLLRRDPTVDGMKTGHTDAAGYCLVASAQRDFPNGKRRLLSVVLNTTSAEARASESQKLLNWGFQAFDALRLFDSGKPMATVPVWKGKFNEAKLGAASSVYVTVPRGEGANLKTAISRTDPLVAPLTKGQRVGTLKVTTAAGAPVAEVPLVVMDAVDEAGIFGRAWDAIRLWIK